ncbi:pentapeptide repeat-containing protein [Streptomyces sp. or20]|uniref:pentapeptide repeat-containing protein n=1 Tax=Streptomyces sp. or20 TaxID=1828016 RepID=UPI00211D24B9|nr:pentapeptide repeat-containing protein [Streptomyces sp. or20]
MSTSEPPTWPHCAQGADPATDPVGCRGIHVPGRTACLAHLTDAERDAYLTGLTPGDSIDHRGTTFTELLFLALLNALRDPATEIVRLGNASFRSATFEGDAAFGSATFEGNASFGATTFKGDARFGAAAFEGNAWFGATTFKGDARFGLATFKGDAWFGSATFEGQAWFVSATFEGDAAFGSATFRGQAWFERATFQSALFESATFKGQAWFESATFEGDAWFGLATFEDHAWFESATFEDHARFGLATFEGDAWFVSATFPTADRFGPLLCAGRIVLSGAAFGGPVTLSFAARRLECRRARWSATAEIRLRYATVDFAHAVFEYPLTIAAEPDPFVLTNGSELAESALAGAPGPDVRVASLRGVDAAHLVLADVDLSGCLFTGTVHLDQLRLEGACTFDTAPSSVRWRRWLPVRFTERRVLAEEHHWRASQPGAVQGWNVAVLGAGRAGPGRCSWLRCTGRCARRSRTGSTSRGPRTSTTGRWRCAATPTTSPAVNAGC